MSVSALGYIVMGVSDIPAWRDYMSTIIGTHVEDSPDGMPIVRIDSRAWRMAFEASDDDDIIAAGWEVTSAATLKAVVEQVRAAGHDIFEDPDLAAKRGVKGLARTIDPAGVVCEFFWGATERFEQPLILSAGGGGFVTGEQGLGHIVLSTNDPQAMLAFYQDILGFQISDFIDDPRGGRITPVTFLHCNGRHHSLAFAEVPAPKKLLHFMLQREALDDVGLALDRLKQRDMPLSLSLGRHVNDHMVSFYAWTPSVSKWNMAGARGSSRMKSGRWFGTSGSASGATIRSIRQGRPERGGIHDVTGTIEQVRGCRWCPHTLS